MQNRPKISIAWSGGKDSTLALHRIINSGQWHVDHLHTVVNADTRGVGLHGIHEDLIERQAGALGFPLKKLYLDPSHTNNAYQKLIQSYCEELKSQGILHMMFGDIFLEDLKDYRDTMLNSIGLTGVYPLWQEDTVELFREFLSTGFHSLLCAADASLLTKEVVGLPLSEEMLVNDLQQVDPCGENGEYHSFVTDGPIFSEPVPVTCVDVISKAYRFEALNEAGETEEHSSTFWFADMRFVEEGVPGN